MSEPIESLPSTPAGSLNILVLGIGSAGGKLLAALAPALGAEARIAALNTDASALNGIPISNKIVLGSQSMRGLGAGGDAERGRAAAEESSEEIRTLCAGATLVVLLTGMGGGTGTGAAPVIARCAKDAGAFVLGLAFMPFDCEGARRQRQAQWGLRQLQDAADGVICLQNQKVQQMIDEKTSLLEAFTISNDLAGQGILGIHGLLTRPGLIAVDFADLCAVVRGKDKLCALATVESSGENRAREAVEKLLAHPFMDGGQSFTEASSVLVRIVGGRELAMGEINRIMEKINRHSEHAHVTMGAAIDESLQERLVLSAIVAYPSVPEKSEEPGSRLPRGGSPGPESHLLGAGPTGSRPASRFVPPPPELPSDKAEQLFAQQSSRGKKSGSRLRQGQLPLEILSRGRFEKSEPTLHHGQDLDVPTYIRRGVALN